MNFWLIDNVRVRKWYYRDAPLPGTMIRYLDETFVDYVHHVTPFAVWTESGRSIRRGYIIERSTQWISNHHMIERVRSWYSARRTARPALVVSSA